MRCFINATIANQTVVNASCAGDVRVDEVRSIASLHSRFFTRAQALGGLKSYFKSALGRARGDGMCSCTMPSWPAWHPQQHLVLLPSVA